MGRLHRRIRRVGGEAQGRGGAARQDVEVDPVEERAGLVLEAKTQAEGSRRSLADRSLERDVLEPVLGRIQEDDEGDLRFSLRGASSEMDRLSQERGRLDQAVTFLRRGEAVRRAHVGTGEEGGFAQGAGIRQPAQAEPPQELPRDLSAVVVPGVGPRRPDEEVQGAKELGMGFGGEKAQVSDEGAGLGELDLVAEVGFDRADLARIGRHGDPDLRPLRGKTTGREEDDLRGEKEAAHRGCSCLVFHDRSEKGGAIDIHRRQRRQS